MTYTVLQSTPYPTYHIDLSTLNNSADISAIMKALDIIYYVYTFEYIGTVLKHGFSVDEKSNFGDRIYRQAGHLEGWPSQLCGPNGNDMRLIDARYFKKTGKHLNRIGTTITVRDLTRVPSPSAGDPHMHVKKLEGRLIEDYKDIYGALPIGNIKDESYINSKTYVPESIWNNLFVANQHA
jgi:hypothetical protein